MNTLTPNRILEKGDEYRKNGSWKPVPENDIGLQIQFTDYAEVRRPSETLREIPHDIRERDDSGQFKPKQIELRETPETANCRTEVAKSPVSPTPLISENPEAMTEFHKSISPKRVADKSATPAKAEGDTSTPSLVATGKGESPAPTPLTGDIDNDYLPKVVSKKAHERKDPVSNVEEIVPCPACGSILCGGDPCVFAKVESKNKLPNHLKIMNGLFPKSDCIWTGRNGSFKAYGLDAFVMEDKVMLFPIGKRGVGNCTIQFPTSVIPELVEWLNKHTPKK